MIEFLCTLAGVIAGGTIVASIMGLRDQQAQEEILSHIENMNIDKIRGITSQLHSLSEKVLDNVYAHSSQIKQFGYELTENQQIDANMILSAVDKIISANQKMQEDLEVAQQQLVQQQEIIEQTTQQANSDVLTGLANRRALEEYLSNLLQTLNDGELVGLLLMDIDHFKRFNDTFGHLTGDAVLTCFARHIVQAIGETGFAARYGGEEFVVVLQASSKNELAERAAAIRHSVSTQSINHEDLELNITASAGLCLVQPGDNLTIAYERSDEGLYKAKELGRNRGVWLDDSTWKPLPDVKVEAEVLGNQQSTLEAQKEVPPTESRVEQEASKEPASDHEDSTEEAEGSLERAEEPELSDSTATQSDSTVDAEAQSQTTLDLATFVDVVKDQMQQLQTMELPGATIMIEAVIHGSSEDTQISWLKIRSMLQTKIRNQDILCYFRPFTICIFLPGCSAEAAYERAADLKNLLVQAKSDWELPCKPNRFAVAVGHMLEKEEVGMMLNRMESALDEAHDAAEREIVIQDGDSTQYLPI